jgi:hypothetical protein
VIRFIVFAVLSLGALACGERMCLALAVCDENQVTCTAGESGCQRVERCGSVVFCRPAPAEAGP